MIEGLGDNDERAHAAGSGKHGTEISAARASWLLIQLRLARLRNQGRHYLGALSTGAQPKLGRRGGSTRYNPGDVGILLGFALLCALLCVQSLDMLEGIEREHGLLGAQARARVLCSILVLSIFVTPLARTSGKVDEDVDWLLTLPAPAWVLHTAKLAEATVMHPIGWMLIFPFLTGLALHQGLGIAAPLLAVVFCVPLFAASALLQWVGDVAGRRYLSAPALRIAQGTLGAVGVTVFATYLATPAMESAKLAPLGHWLDFSKGFDWLPFAEPALVVTSISREPARALLWFMLFLLEMAGILGIGVLALRRVFSAGLVEGQRTFRRPRGSHTWRQQLARRRLFHGVVAKDLLWLRRNPARTAALVLNCALANAAAIVLILRTGNDFATGSNLGAAAFGVGMWQLILLIVITEAERPAMFQLSALPRTLSRTFAEKAIFAWVFASASSLPLLIYASRTAPSLTDALPSLGYAYVGLLVHSFIWIALWLWRVTPNGTASPLQYTWRILQLALAAGFFSAGFAFSSLVLAVPLVVLASAFAFTLWHDSLAGVPFAFDPNARRIPRLSATYAILAILSMRGLQMQGLQMATAAGLHAWLGLMVSFVLAGSVVVVGSLLLLKVQRVPGWAEVLGLLGSKGWKHILREGFLWSSPAIAVVAAFAWLSRPGWPLAPIVGEMKNRELSIFSHSHMFLSAALTILAAPILEELLFRGLLYRALRYQWGVAVSLLLSAAVFTVGHPLAAAVPLFCMAACATLAFERSQSLFAAMLVHGAYNGFVAWTVLSG